MNTRSIDFLDSEQINKMRERWELGPPHKLDGFASPDPSEAFNRMLQMAGFDSSASNDLFQTEEEFMDQIHDQFHFD